MGVTERKDEERANWDLRRGMMVDLHDNIDTVTATEALDIIYEIHDIEDGVINLPFGMEGYCSFYVVLKELSSKELSKKDALRAVKILEWKEVISMGVKDRSVPLAILGIVEDYPLRESLNILINHKEAAYERLSFERPGSHYYADISGEVERLDFLVKKIAKST